ncbi:hypothetical protein KQX54_020657 [Cotesia glomerata]|uniref:Uncharacterized protein n=1 Tax=Cotesia glomerata TaxID=32391 RepID=A0AAV7I3D9_COTGL|nr:hypothetical protein KQX54_020657 [Cotesia glomerata]
MDLAKYNFEKTSDGHSRWSDFERTRLCSRAGWSRYPSGAECISVGLLSTTLGFSSIMPSKPWMGLLYPFRVSQFSTVESSCERRKVGVMPLSATKKTGDSREVGKRSQDHH